ADLPVQSGTVIGSLPFDTVRSTVVPGRTRAPSSADASSTTPLATFSSHSSVTLPSSRWAAVSAAFTSVSFSPTSVGTSYRSGPFDNTRDTSLPGGNSVPARGSVRITRPDGTVSEYSGSPTVTENRAAVSWAVAASSVRLATVGVATGRVVTNHQPPTAAPAVSSSTNSSTTSPRRRRRACRR